MLKETIQTDLLNSMKNKDQKRSNVLRSLKTAFSNMEKLETNIGKTLVETDYIAVLQKLIKQREDSIEQYSKASRTDLATIETEELEVLKLYAPVQMTVEEVSDFVSNVLKTGTYTVRDFGTIMKICSTELKGKTDGKTISEIVKTLLK